jgi:hypothetical protein
MARRHTAHFLAVASIASAMAGTTDGKAQDLDPPGIVLDGMARTGTDTRPVRFRFFCSSNRGPNVTGVLSVVLEVSRYEQLRAVFDFDPLEGPDANAGPLTSLQASGARAKANDRFTAAGSVVPSGSSEAFALEVTASRREPGPLRKLASVLRPLTDGPGNLVWQQGSAKPGGTPMNASLDLAQAQTDQLKTGLGPCLGAR